MKDTSKEDPWGDEWGDEFSYKFEKTINKDLLFHYKITVIAFNIYKKTDRDYKRLLFLNHIDIAGEELLKSIKNILLKNIVKKYC